jgi:hypothetical protein
LKLLLQLQIGRPSCFAVLASHEELVEAAEAKLPGSGVSRSGASSWFWSFWVLVGM